MVDQKLIIVSGPIAVGKSSIIRCLVQSHNFFRLSSRAYLEDLAQRREIGQSRLNLVQLGDLLDEETDFNWVVYQVAIPAMNKDPEQPLWIFDSVRKRKQVSHFRNALPGRVFHVHFTAPDDVLKSRYVSRDRESDTATNFEQAIDTDNERESRSLRELADLVVDTNQTDKEDATAQTIEGFLKWSKLF
nr:AAA family ATPase [uncultured Hyphomonas sp.]